MGRMFSINLNREEGYAQKEARKRRIRERVTMVIVSILLIAMTYVTVENHLEVSGIIDAKEAQIDSINAQIRALQRQGREVNKEDVYTLARLERERVLWARRLHALAERMPEEMVLTTLELERGAFKFSAIAPIETDEREFDMVTMFIERLKSTPMYYQGVNSVKFTESNRMNADTQELINFVITSEMNMVDAGRRGRVRRASSTTRGGR